MCSFDSSDTKNDCQSLCPCPFLSDGICDPGTIHTACNTPECHWDSGDCGYCSPGCKKYAGWESDLGNGKCETTCNTESCYWDMGDCITESNPLPIYVSSEAHTGPYTGPSLHPHTSLVTAIQTLWAPYNTLYLLSGVHYLQLPGINTTHIISISVPHLLITTLFCTDFPSNPSECASDFSTIQLTPNDINFLINLNVTIENVIIKGGFSLVENCEENYCTYCPSVHYNNTIGGMSNDRNEPIGRYAWQEMCEKYGNSALLRMEPESKLSLGNVRFERIRHQPMAVIVNKCADLEMKNVTFSDITPQRLGLAGAVVQQIPLPSYEPYYCGSFSFSSGLVELLNNGYEYSPSNLFSGFALLTSLHFIHISHVTFQFNYMLLGQTQQLYGSSLLFLRKFRQMQVWNCTFRYNIADTGAAFYIYTALNTPLIVENGVATEQKITHLDIQDNYFFSNTGREGSVIFIQFMGDHQNIYMKNNTFLDNFGTDGAILKLSFGDLKDKYTIGEFITALVHDSLETVFIPPIQTYFQDTFFISNYAPVTCSVSSVANFLLSNATFIDNGDSQAGLTSYEFVVGAFSANPDIYMQSPPPAIAPNKCTSTFNIFDSYNVTVTDVSFQGLICSNGTPGLSLSGNTRYVSFI